MRRDLVYFYPLPVEQVYDAFFRAANERFGKDCKTDPFKTLTFGLNFSFKYNMNGGAITAHFMPYQNGTAVDLRYSIVQAMGARYKAHARDYTQAIDGILGVQATPTQIDIQQFLDYETRTQSFSGQQPSQPMPAEQPEQELPRGGFCSNCGTPVAPEDLFCSECGNKLR